MKRIIIIILVMFLASVLGHTGNYKLTETEDIIKKLDFLGAGPGNSLSIDNVFGSIHLDTHQGKHIELVIKKTIRARDKEALIKAKKEVSLKITPQKNLIDILVDGPFRSKEGGHIQMKGDPGYRVLYDFRVSVPVNTSIIAKTIDNGDISIKGIKGSCKLSNVTGPIEVNSLVGNFKVSAVKGDIRMNGIRGAGAVQTVSGQLDIQFLENPASLCVFKTLSGDMEINFLEGLSADFNLKNQFGDIFSDFTGKDLPVKIAPGKRKKGKFIYKSTQSRGIRIGKGGPEIKMETLNGNIYIAKAK